MHIRGLRLTSIGLRKVTLTDIGPAKKLRVVRVGVKVVDVKLTRSALPMSSPNHA